MEKYLSVKELEEEALALLPKNSRDYYKSGATDEHTLAENRLSFQKLRIRPKCLTGITACDMSTTILGNKITMPVGISPSAMQRMAHPDGEIANVKDDSKVVEGYVSNARASGALIQSEGGLSKAIELVLKGYFYRGDANLVEFNVTYTQRVYLPLNGVHGTLIDPFSQERVQLETSPLYDTNCKVKFVLSKLTFIREIIAAEAAGTIYTLSTISTSSIEEVAEAAPSAVKWFQLYIYKDREITRSMVKRAEKAGFQAIVLTVDTPVFGLRRADVRNQFALPPHLRLANFVGSGEENVKKGGSTLNTYVQTLFDKTLTWEDIQWLKSITKLPIVAKGVLRGGDAVKAVQAGCAAILVSNHGARQLDGVPATIEALPEIVEAVKQFTNVEIYMDGGVMTGTDVYKALALGAKMVFVGRPALWGLAVGGQAGVQRMLSIFRTELEYALQISGTPTLDEVTRDMVRQVSEYSKL